MCANEVTSRHTFETFDILYRQSISIISFEFSLSNSFKMGKRKKTTKKAASDDLVVFNSDRNEDTEGAVRQYKPLPGRIEKGPYETQDQFMGRLNRLVGKAMGEAEIEAKFDVDFCEKTGRNEFDEVFRTGKTISKNKLEKRRERNRKRKEKRRGKGSHPSNRTDEFGVALDRSGKSRVAFGDVVHSPPDLDKIKKAFDAKIQKSRQRRVR